jgi:hypothetical protein
VFVKVEVKPVVGLNGNIKNKNNKNKKNGKNIKRG